MTTKPQDNAYLYWYEADVLRCVDGDTVDVNIRLGCGVYRKDRLRLMGINAWESRGPERIKGKAATKWLKEQIEGKRIVIQTVLDKGGRYGRLLAFIHLGDRCLNDELVEQGHAVYRDY